MKKEIKKQFKFKINSEFNSDIKNTSCKECSQTDCFYWILNNVGLKSYNK